MKFTAYVSLLALFCSATWAQTEADYKALSRRLEQLEKQHQEFILQSGETHNSVNSFLRDDLTLGGFFESGFSIFDGEDTSFKALNDSNILGINLAAEFAPRLRFVSQFITGLTYPLRNPHNSPSLTPSERKFQDPFFGALLTQGYVEYSYSEGFRIQAGTGYVPFGYALQQRELVLFVRRGGPQILRTSNLVSPLWGGLHALGDFKVGKGEWGYNAYTSNPIAGSEVSGLGGRLWWASEQEKVTAGVSSQIGKFRNHTDEIVGSDIRIKTQKYIITSEYIRHITQGEDPWSVYFEPSMYIYDETFLLYVFGDYANSSLSMAGASVRLPYEKWEYGAGVNWLPSVYTRIRFGLTYYDYRGSDAIVGTQNKDFYGIDLSAGVAF